MGARVLVVEDDHDIRESLLDVLHSLGCEAVGAPNGRAAMEILHTSTELPTFILLDLMMPVMDGRAFREEQRRSEAFGHVPVVVYSAYREVVDVARDLEAAAWLEKPIDMQKLRQLASALTSVPPEI
jgi:CheY-like chemotaxis protein